MSDLPKKITIKEEGPREGFQYEKGPIATARKIELIDALSQTGLKSIATVSFVNPKRVPGMADAEQVIAGITPNPDVNYSALALNDQGIERALATKRVKVGGAILLVAADTFAIKNLNKNKAEQLAAQPSMIEMVTRHGLKIDTLGIMAAFGCNYEGVVAPQTILDLIADGISMAKDNGVSVKRVSLADTMGHATPYHIKKLVGIVRERYPDLEVVLHLHDTRGMGVANVFAGMEMGVSHFDASVAGLGGCPFASNAGAAGNVCTEDVVFMCDEIGIETGISLDALIDCAELAEDIVGHPLPGSVMKGGSLKKLRAKMSAAAE